MQVNHTHLNACVCIMLIDSQFHSTYEIVKKQKGSYRSTKAALMNVLVLQEWSLYIKFTPSDYGISTALLRFPTSKAVATREACWFLLNFHTNKQRKKIKRCQQIRRSIQICKKTVTRLVSKSKNSRTGIMKEPKKLKRNGFWVIWISFWSESCGGS